ncbi:DUF3168 domain-containing protein [Priestia megaterium]|uniref:DUF3168 domain-containing protein n=1 Tax=Priestia megaterium TaxID=1404 RepID=UPI000BEB5BAD|nr:DUF3168 domain-containing protein [Priestia megaterium]PED63973.1 hypothetical protein CON20_23690 [Priestia megaterium]
MATKMFEVQQKIFTSLTGDSELTGMVKGVFDYVPEDTPLPYINFGHILSESDFTKTDSGETITFTLDIWSMAKGRKESVQILTKIEQILEAEIQLDSAFIMRKQVTNRQVVEESYGLFHASLDIQFKLEWEE